MGIFDFLKKKEVEAEKVIEIYSPITGKFVALEDVPDRTFAGKLLGDGMAVEPIANGEILAPVSGKLVQLFKTGHAFTIDAGDDVNVLVHFGIDTVELHGRGFTPLVEEGVEVKKGQPIVRYDYNILKEEATSVITPVVVLEADSELKVEVENLTDIVAGETLIMKIKK